jgi:hypothetical protein
MPKQLEENHQTILVVDVVTPATSEVKNPFSYVSKPQVDKARTHRYGKKIGKEYSKICRTDSRGYATPDNQNPAEIVVDSSQGFIPLWEKNQVLCWQFNEESLAAFENPNAAQTNFKKLFAEAVLAWGDAAPIRFTQVNSAWDFEVVFRRQDDCYGGGCVLASAFFPDSGRHRLVIYPKMFQQDRHEQVETLIHELGHIFGLRHFFANISEKGFPSEIFGQHDRFTIMNYGSDSKLTPTDTSDLKKLYESVWSRQLTEINKTPIHLVIPYHKMPAML